MHTAAVTIHSVLMGSERCRARPPSANAAMSASAIPHRRLSIVDFPRQEALMLPRCAVMVRAHIARGAAMSHDRARRVGMERKRGRGAKDATPAEIALSRRAVLRGSTRHFASTHVRRSHRLRLVRAIAGDDAAALSHARTRFL